MRFSRWPRGWLKHEKSHTEQEVRFKNLKHGGGRRNGSTSVAGARLHTDNDRRQGGAE